MRTGEHMAMTFSTQPATGAILARIAWIDFGDGQAVHLCLVGSSLSNSAMLPEREPTTQSVSSDLALLRLRHVQVLKDEDSVLRCPLDKLLRGLLGKGAGTMALFATKPFHDTSDASCVLVLCLAGRMFGLEPATGLCGTTVLDFDGLATDKQFSAIRIDGYQSIRFIEINPNGENTSRFRNIQRECDSAYQLPIAQDNIEAINLFGLLKSRLEIFWNGIVQVPSACCRPDRQGAILAKIGITPTAADEKQCPCSLEEKWTFCRLPIGFRTLIGCTDRADSRNSHLGGERTFNLMVHQPLQGKSAKRLAVIVARFRQSMLYLSEHFKRVLQVL